MKLTGILLLVFSMHLSASSLAQKVTLKAQNSSLKNVFKELNRQTGYYFIYNENIIKNTRSINIEVASVSLKTALDEIFNNQPLTYTLKGNTIIVIQKQNVKPIKDIVLEGVVISSANNLPVPGVTIWVEGTNAVTSTNSSGEYKLKVSSDAKYVSFSSTGFETKKLELNNLNLFKLVTLIEQVNKLEDVVVVGFGTQKKASLVGAVQSVKPSQLTNTSSNLTTAFAGNIAGIIASQSSGEPGYDGAAFYIRGVSTFGANKNPLIVLDGVEITNAMLNNIPPETIEAFSILKDATATALYGSRGANGVIIINTKSGRDSEKMTINVRLDNTFSMPTHIQDIANGVTYMNAYNEAVKNNTPTGQTYVPFYSDTKIEGTQNRLNPYLFPDNNWYSMLFKDYSVNQNFNFNMSGGSQKVDYFLNASVFNENGIVNKPMDGNYDTGINNKKYLFQSNVSSDLTSTTRVGLKMNTQLWYNDRPFEDISNLFYYTMRANPVRFPATLPAEPGDTFVRYGNNSSWDVGPIDLNPYALLSRGYAKRYYSYLTTALTVDQDLKSLINGLSAKALVSFYNYTYSANNRSFSPFYFKVNDNNYTVNPDGTYNFTTESIGNAGNTYLTSTVALGGHREYAVQGSLNYARQFGAHDVGAMVVYHHKEKVLNTPTTNENDILPFREQGVAGRLTYNYNSRYLAELNFGYNGSENFIAGKRFGFFPSAAVGYVISNEHYFEPLKEVVDQLKIRASYGLSGNDALATRFPYLTTVTMGNSLGFYNGINYSNTTGPKIAVIGNPDATWEEAKKFNIGIDLGILKSFNLTLDYFHEDRSGIFMQRASLPTSMGLAGSTPYANIGKVKNSGVDFTLGYNKSFSKDLNLNIQGTFTYAHNEVVAKDEPKLLYPYTSVIGHPINTTYGLVSDKLFASPEDIASSPKQEFANYKPGDIKYRDLNNDGRIDGNDITALGRPTIPEIMYGFNAGITYRKWNVSFLLQGADRVSLLMRNIHPFVDAGSFGFNITQYIADNHWSEANPNIDAAYPRLSSTWSVNNVQTSDFWVKNAAYLRIKNAEIGYRANKFVRFYVAGSNLLTFSTFKYWDPEMGSGNGLDYPLQRTLKLGFQFQF